ncbi:type II toxin-antitoxin system Phd/YefM family antitoxin [Gracilinema caldarium]|uniref:type II toxin-antitoxin system Phd/YefM family antitoxin n=1 Tax=Gracilinema caldarium TaxID=215591 RepID=UPI0026EF7CA8|nr:type II toxin-antitoxin system Phd/YefM family antitoxin [Gracilinema caldarium]
MVNLSTDIKPISYIKSHTAEIIRQVGENKNPVIITQNGEAKAVILDVDSYQNLVNAVNLMKLISIGDQDLKNGKIVAHEEVKKRISKILE